MGPVLTSSPERFRFLSESYPGCTRFESKYTTDFSVDLINLKELLCRSARSSRRHSKSNHRSAQLCLGSRCCGLTSAPVVPSGRSLIKRYNVDIRRQRCGMRCCSDCAFAASAEVHVFIRGNLGAPHHRDGTNSFHPHLRIDKYHGRFLLFLSCRDRQLARCYPGSPSHLPGTMPPTSPNLTQPNLAPAVS